MKTYEEYLKIVDDHKDYFMKVPENIIDYKMCEVAVRADGEALEYVPTHLIDENLCNIAVDNKLPCSLYMIPLNLTTERTINILLESRSDTLKYIRYDMIDYETCQKAVEKFGAAIEHVPKSYIDDKLCKIAVSNEPLLAIEHVPSYLIHRGLYSIAIEGGASINNILIDAVDRIQNRK